MAITHSESFFSNTGASEWPNVLDLHRRNFVLESRCRRALFEVPALDFAVKYSQEHHIKGLARLPVICDPTDNKQCILDLNILMAL
jgi:hypothetical protein